MHRPSARTITAVLRRSAAAVAVLAITGGALAAGSSAPAKASSAPAEASAAPAEASASPSFLALATPGESFPQIARQAAMSDGAQVATVIQAMIGRVATGHAVDVPQGTRSGVTDSPATLAELKAALSTARSVSATAPAAVPQTSPSQFPINGVGCHQTSEYYAAWCGKYEYTTTVCNEELGCEVVNRLTVKITVNPAVKTSLVSYSSTYFYLPEYGRLYSDIHFEWWVLCFSSSRQCGTGNSKNFEGNSSGKFYPKSTTTLYGDRVTHAFKLWIKFAPNGRFYGQEGKTGEALCDEKPERACVY